MQHEDIQTVRLILNEGQARAKLDGLRAQLEDVRKKRQEALDRGDASALRLYDQEIKKITRQMERMQSRAENIGQVLTHLDQASPRQLQNTLRRITQELNSGAVQRGSQEWNALSEALRMVRTELQNVQDGLNGTTSTTTDPWVRLHSIVGVLRSGADALGALRSQMANIHKPPLLRCVPLGLCQVFLQVFL